VEFLKETVNIRLGKTLVAPISDGAILETRKHLSRGGGIGRRKGLKKHLVNDLILSIN
jgi:hypothetical protein